MSKKHQEHIVCIKSEKVNHHKDGFVDYSLNNADLMLGQRKSLEQDGDFRQVLPMSIFTHKGKVWAYERTSAGGERRLHNKVAVAVGGHWDLEDLVVENSIINLKESLSRTMARELEEEVKLSSTIIKTTELERKVCAMDTEVDRLHLAVVFVHELDGEELDSSEDQLKTIGFISPDELLSGEYNIETWARIICEILAAK